jgi:hypothetical protein
VDIFACCTLKDKITIQTNTSTIKTQEESIFVQLFGQGITFLNSNENLSNQY